MLRKQQVQGWTGQPGLPAPGLCVLPSLPQPPLFLGPEPCFTAAGLLRSNPWRYPAPDADESLVRLDTGLRDELSPAWSHISRLYWGLHEPRVWLSPTSAQGRLRTVRPPLVDSAPLPPILFLFPRPYLGISREKPLS